MDQLPEISSSLRIEGMVVDELGAPPLVTGGVDTSKLNDASKGVTSTQNEITKNLYATTDASTSDDSNQDRGRSYKRTITDMSLTPGPEPKRRNSPGVDPSYFPEKSEPQVPYQPAGSSSTDNRKGKETNDQPEATEDDPLANYSIFFAKFVEEADLGGNNPSGDNTPPTDYQQVLPDTRLSSAKSKIVSVQGPAADPNFTNVVSSGQVEKGVDTGMSTDAAPVGKPGRREFLELKIGADDWTVSIIQALKETKTGNIQPLDADESLVGSMPAQKPEAPIAAEPTADPNSANVTSYGQGDQRANPKKSTNAAPVNEPGRRVGSDLGQFSNARGSGSPRNELSSGSQRSEAITVAHFMRRQASNLFNHDIEQNRQKPDEDMITVESVRGAGGSRDRNKDPIQAFDTSSDQYAAPANDRMNPDTRPQRSVSLVYTNQIVTRYEPTPADNNGPEESEAKSLAKLGTIKESLANTAEKIAEVMPSRTWGEFVEETISNRGQSESLSTRLRAVNIQSLREYQDHLATLGSDLQNFANRLEQNEVNLKPEYQRAATEYQKLGGEIQQHAQNFNTLIEHLGKDQPDYNAIARLAGELKTGLLATQDKLIKATWNPTYKKFSEHANAWYGIVIVSVIVSALNSIYPSIVKGKVDIGAFFGGLAAGIAGNTILSKLKLFPENAILQTVAGQTLVISSGELVAYLESKNG